MTESSWSVSGLCITARPEDLETVARSLEELPGVELHGSEPETGRLIAVQEAATVEEHQTRLRQIQAVPGVLTADLVVHLRDSDGSKRARHEGEA